MDLNGIDKLPSGRFRLRKQVEGQKITGTFATAKKAAETRDAALRKLADGIAEHVAGESIRALSATFLGSRNGNRASKTDVSRWKHVKNARFASKPIVLIARTEILDWLAALKKVKSTKREGRTLSRASRKHCLNLLRAFFAWALDREKVKSNPCADITIAREDGDEDDGYQDDWYLDVKEQRELLSAMPEGVDRRMVAVALGTGLRLGELLCLHTADVHATDDEPSPRIMVRFGSWDAGKKRYRPPKGRTGEKKMRVVSLFGIGLAAVREQLADMQEKNKYGLLFPSRWGGRRTKPPKSFLSLAELARLGRKPWWHLLRHACASSLVAGWWGKRWLLQDASKVLGHSSVEVTERYAHLIPSVVAERATEAQAAWISCHDTCHDDGTPNANQPIFLGRATKDSNFRPSASEDDESRKKPPKNGPHDKRMTAIAAIDRALVAISKQDRFALRRCVDALGLAREIIGASGERRLERKAR